VTRRRHPLLRVLSPVCFVLPVCFAGGCDAILGYGDLQPRQAPQDAGNRDATTGDGAPTDARSDAACELPLGGNACMQVPHFVGQQVVDGYDTDFCNIPGTAFAYTSGLLITQANLPPITLAGGTPDSAVIRVAWSTDALHVFVHVIDPSWVVPPPEAGVAECSSVEIYVAGTAALTGDYNGTNDGGAIQVILSAPPTQGQAFYNTAAGDSVGHRSVMLDPSLYAGVATSDGYSVELLLPWSALAETIAPGAQIAFDVAFDVEDTPDAGGRQYQSIYTCNSVEAGAPSCGTLMPEPWCDDRTWCTPTLQ
jgi:hypothetical protein